MYSISGGFYDFSAVLPKKPAHWADPVKQYHVICQERRGGSHAVSCFSSVPTGINPTRSYEIWIFCHRLLFPQQTKERGTLSTKCPHFSCWDSPKPFCVLPLNIPSERRLLLRFCPSLYTTPHRASCVLIISTII